MQDIPSHPILSVISTSKESAHMVKKVSTKLMAINAETSTPKPYCLDALKLRGEFDKSTWKS